MHRNSLSAGQSEYGDHVKNGIPIEIRFGVIG